MKSNWYKAISGLDNMVKKKPKIQRPWVFFSISHEFQNDMPSFMAYRCITNFFTPIASLFFTFIKYIPG